MRDVYRATAGSRASRRRVLGRLSLVLLPFFPAAAALAGFGFPEPASQIYYTLAAAAGEEVSLEHDAQVTGSLHSNGRVVVKEDASVQGDISAAGPIDVRGTVSGTVTPGAPARPLPHLYSEAEARAIADRVFEQETVFENMTIDDVVFVDGKARLLGAVNGIGTLIATGGIDLEHVDPGTGPGLLHPSTYLSLVSFQHVKIHPNRSFRGVAYAASHVMVEQDVRFEGVAVAGQQVQIRQGAVVTFRPPDLDPPGIQFVSPADGAFAVARPRIEIRFVDPLSGVDPATVLFTVDGIDRTAAAQVTADGLIYTPAEPLSEAPHTLEVAVADRAGNPGSGSSSFRVDAGQPLVTIVSPSGVDILGTVLPPVEITYSDLLSGVVPESLRVSLDGAVLSCTAGPAGATCPSPERPEGIHSLVVEVRDVAGNSTVAERGVRTVSDLEPPTVAILSPADGAFLAAASPQVSASFADAGSGIDVQSVRLLIDGIDFTSAATVSAAGLTWTPAEPLSETLHAATVEVSDRVGRKASAAISFTVDATPPALAVEAPAPGLTLNRDQVEVTGEVADENGAAVQVDGQPVDLLSGGRFQVALTLAEGPHTVTVRAEDPAGNVRQEARQVTRVTLPEVSITSPEDLSTVAAATVRVSGTVSDPAATVVVNGVAAAVSGTAFTAEDVPLIEGGNLVTATATSALGRMGTDTVSVVRDLTAPQVLIHDPEDAARVFTPTVTVSGMVNDIVAGTVNASEAAVTVNGRPASVANRSFVVEGVPLQPGENVLTAVATDEGGNTSQDEITVRLEAANVSRLAVVSGDLQTGQIGQPLAQPLVVAVLDAAGQPVAGRPVLFSLRDGNGSLDGGLRQVAATTGTDGRAQVRFTLGTRAGAANQIVEASAVGFAGPAVFRATATAGEPKHILPDAGGLQVGIAGQPLPRPLVAAVTDAGFNRLGEVAVRLRVIQGGGKLPGGLPETVVTTDSDGRILVPFTLGPEEGIANNVVEATIADLDPSPKATFVASGRVAGDPAATSISGVVLDNVNRPVPGVTLRIKEQPALTAQADAQGQFRIAGAPVGTVHLIVDGSTATRPGSWPDLEFVLTTVPGRDNTVNMPIYLLPLNLADGLYVDETRGGTLTLPEFPGFALEVLPGSVTFPGGSRSGLISVTAVHADKVPMVPNFGQQPRFIVTIQPAGARFDPPARLILPNLEGLAPGEVTEMYSFDHDLGHFVSIGPGTVSADSLVIVSNPGVGVIKAGWHCGGNPAAAGTPADCPSCQICDGNACVPGCALGATASAPGIRGIFEAQCNCTDDGDPCTVNDRCQAGGCKGDPVNVTGVTGHCATNVNTPVSLTAQSNAPSRVKWVSYDGGTPAEGNGATFAPRWSSLGIKSAAAYCKTTVYKKVSVLKKCSDGVTEPTVVNEVPSSIPANHDGYFFGHNPTYFLIPCTNAPSNQYCLALSKFESRAGYTLATGHVADINSAADVVPADCDKVLPDITPSAASTWNQPPTVQYWSSQITRAHEEKHRQDWIDQVLKPTLAELNAYLAGKCQGCASPIPSADVEAKYLEILNAKKAAFELVKEPDAFAQSNAAYSNLVAAIRARARAENWKAVCQ